MPSDPACVFVNSDKLKLHPTKAHVFVCLTWGFPYNRLESLPFVCEASSEPLRNIMKVRAG